MTRWMHFKPPRRTTRRFCRGLIEISVDDWIQRLAEMQTARPKTIVDGIRIRDIMVAVTGGSITRTLTRSDAGERGQPYRNLAPRN